jgi:hypothetical protein
MAGMNLRRARNMTVALDDELANVSEQAEAEFREEKQNALREPLEEAQSDFWETRVKELQLTFAEVRLEFLEDGSLVS